jgi:hypothetical protein
VARFRTDLPLRQFGAGGRRLARQVNECNQVLLEPLCGSFLGWPFSELSYSLLAQEAGLAPPATDRLVRPPRFLTPPLRKSSCRCRRSSVRAVAKLAQQPATGIGCTLRQPALRSARSKTAASQSSSSAQQSSSSPQAPTPPPTSQQSQHDKAAEQIKEQEKQRVVGILPSFNVTYRSDAASMSASQKIGLAFRSAIDPYQFGIAFVVAGLSEAQDNGTGFGWGPEGYFKRSGAAYLDAFDGAMIGNGLLPALSAPGSALLPSRPRHI